MPALEEVGSDSVLTFGRRAHCGPSRYCFLEGLSWPFLKAEPVLDINCIFRFFTWEQRASSTIRCSDLASPAPMTRRLPEILSAWASPS